jgi:pentapeptide MXKDX repeat protein
MRREHVVSTGRQYRTLNSCSERVWFGRSIRKELATVLDAQTQCHSAGWVRHSASVSTGAGHVAVLVRSAQQQAMAWFGQHRSRAETCGLCEMGWDGMGWDAMRWDAMGCDGMRWDAMGCDGMRWDAMGWDAMGWDGMRWDVN